MMRWVPPSPPGFGHVTGPHDDVPGVLPLLRVPHPQVCLCMGEGGVSVGPAICLCPGAISMKEDWVQGAPLHTQTSYAGTRALMRHRASVAHYNRLFAQSIVALCSGVGGKIPPWGKGLICYISCFDELCFLKFSFPNIISWNFFYFAKPQRVLRQFSG